MTEVMENWETIEPVRTVFNIPSPNMGKLQEKIEKLNKKAKKFGLPLVTIEVLEEKHYKQDDGSVQVWYKISVNGKRPVLNGWKFLGTLIKVEDVGMLIRAVPGESIPVKYRNTTHKCEHCNTNRYRKETFIVQNIETGETKQVGRNCLQDFTGYPNDPQHIAEYYEWLGELNEEIEYMAETGYPSSGRSNYLDLETYLTHVAAVIREYGWVPRKRLQEDPSAIATADRALDNMFPPLFVPNYKLIHITEEDVEEAKKALKWAEENLHNCDKDKLNDYLYNLSVVTSVDAITFQMCGIAASLIPTYQRAVEGEHNKSEYVGTVGQKGIWKLTVKRATPITTQFGTKVLLVMEDANSNVFICFANDKLNVGETYTIKGKIKEHKEYQGVKQTVIYYAKIM